MRSTDEDAEDRVRLHDSSNGAVVSSEESSDSEDDKYYSLSGRFTEAVGEKVKLMKKSFKDMFQQYMVEKAGYALVIAVLGSILVIPIIRLTEHYGANRQPSLFRADSKYPNITVLPMELRHHNDFFVELPEKLSDEFYVVCFVFMLALLFPQLILSIVLASDLTRKQIGLCTALFLFFLTMIAYLIVMEFELVITGDEEAAAIIPLITASLTLLYSFLAYPLAFSLSKRFAPKGMKKVVYASLAIFAFDLMFIIVCVICQQILLSKFFKDSTSNLTRLSIRGPGIIFCVSLVIELGARVSVYLSHKCDFDNLSHLVIVKPIMMLTVVGRAMQVRIERREE